MNHPAKIGKYEIEQPIGEGAFGIVYLGRDPYIRRKVAIKVCTARDESLRRRFLREAEIAGNLYHRHITTIYELGFDDNAPYLVQEYLTGEDLKAKIQRRDPLPPARRVRYLLEVARGLEYAHSQGVLHRDIKPGNIRVLDNDQVKIMDFGIARLASAETALTQLGSILGTPGYLSPEQVLGREADERSDVFAFGALAYELLTYRKPYRGDGIDKLLRDVLQSEPPPLTASWPECPPALAALVKRCLEKDPSERYQGFAPIIQELNGIFGRLRSQVLPEAPPPETDTESGTQEIEAEVARSAARGADLATRAGVHPSELEGAQDDADAPTVLRTDAPPAAPPAPPSPPGEGAADEEPGREGAGQDEAGQDEARQDGAGHEDKEEKGTPGEGPGPGARTGTPADAPPPPPDETRLLDRPPGTGAGREGGTEPPPPPPEKTRHPAPPATPPPPPEKTVLLGRSGTGAGEDATQAGKKTGKKAGEAGEAEEDRPPAEAPTGPPPPERTVLLGDAAAGETPPAPPSGRPAAPPPGPTAVAPEGTPGSEAPASAPPPPPPPKKKKTPPRKPPEAPRPAAREGATAAPSQPGRDARPAAPAEPSGPPLAERLSALAAGAGATARRLGDQGRRAAVQARDAARQRPKVAAALAGAFLLVLLVVVVAAALLGGDEEAPAVVETAPAVPAAPAPLPPGEVLVEARPWGEVTSITGADGEERPLPPDPVTPLVLELPPGRYELTLRHPDAEEPGTCLVEVSETGATDPCAVALLEAEGQEYFREAGWWR